ncbi:hypothetical protein V1512DRAFT_104670 [Lipomyces arxii]|uniref:uncharacterized protein n=1 Tax=Lipomyces arxii TaxID=56418 RepID=UPI0034CE9227
MPPRRPTRKRTARAQRARGFGVFNETASGDDEEDLDYKAEYDGEAADYAEDSDAPLSSTRTRRSNETARRPPKRARAEPTKNKTQAVDLNRVCYFDKVPLELTAQVLDYLLEFELGLDYYYGDLSKHQKRTIAKYSIVSKLFRDIIQPKLFESLKIVQLKALYQFSTILQRSPYVRQYTKHLRIELQSSIEEESNMVAGALRNTVPRCNNLSRLEVFFHAPMGFQVIFPLLGQDFYAPSVQWLDITLGVFTSSFMPFVGGFNGLQKLHLNGINFDRLLISDRDKTLSLSSIKTLMLTDCFVGQSTVNLLPSVLPKIQTISLFAVKGLTTDFLLAMNSHCADFASLNVYRCGDAKGRSTSRQPFLLPVRLWTSLREIRILFCGNVRAESFPTFGTSGVTELRNLKRVQIAEMVRSYTGDYVPALVKAVTRLGDVLNSGDEVREFEVTVTFRRALEPHANSIEEAFSDEFLQALAMPLNENVVALRTVQDEVDRGSWALTLPPDTYAIS